MPLVTYSALRVALLGACFALGYWAGLRTWLLLVVATFAAWGLSYVLLQGPRDSAALYLAEREQRRAARAARPAADPDAAHEDAVVDAAQRPTAGDDARTPTPAAAPESRPRDDRPGTGPDADRP